MKNAALRRGRTENEPTSAIGTARLDRRVRSLIPRLEPGDVAVIDHMDLDRVSAESLAVAGVAAVVNAAPSISGRYPCLGPEVLVAAGVPLLDAVGQEVFGALREGTRVRLEGDTLYAGHVAVATGVRQDQDSVAEAMLAAREGMSSQLESFAASTAEYLRTDCDLLLDGAGIPATLTDLAGRHVVVVVRGYDDRADLAALRPYLREYRPMLIGVNGGADTLLAAGHIPNLVVGDLDGISDQALTCGAELVLRADPNGGIRGLHRVLDCGVAAVLCVSAGTAVDLALLLACDKGAELVVTVGAPATLNEFLDRGRAGTASTFLTRIRAGARVVDAKAVRVLHRSRISGGALLLLVLAALVAVAATLVASAAGQPVGETLSEMWHRLATWVGGLFT